MTFNDRIQQNSHTGRYHIDGGLKGYHTYDSAHNALTSYDKRVAKGVQDAIDLEKSLKK